MRSGLPNSGCLGQWIVPDAALTPIVSNVLRFGLVRRRSETVLIDSSKYLTNEMIFKAHFCNTSCCAYYHNGVIVIISITYT